MTASLAAFKTFKSAGVVVFADSRKDGGKLPSGAMQVRSQGGNTLPMVLATTPDGATGIGAASYNELKKDARKAARKLKKLATTKMASFEEEEEPVTAEVEEKSTLLAAERAWTNAQGKTIRAAVVSVDGKNVQFLIKKKQVSYPLSKLSAQSRYEIKQLAK